jgi:hypothetical protein
MLPHAKQLTVASIVIREATYLRGRWRPELGHRRCVRLYLIFLYLIFLCTLYRLTMRCYSHVRGQDRHRGVWIMQALHADSSGQPVAFDSISPSHHARHGFSRRAFIGGAAAATGATLGSGLLSPAAALAWQSQPAPKPTTAITTIGGVDSTSPPSGRAWTRHRSPISRALSASQTCGEPGPPGIPTAASRRCCSTPICAL